MNHTLELLGIGAAKDRELKRNLLEALQQLGVDMPVQEVREIDRLLAYGISGIPALMVDGQVVFQKVVPSVADLRVVLGALFSSPTTPLRIRQIVVPTDFSETARNAFQYALDLAQHLGATVRLVHVHQASGDLGGTLLFDGVSEALHYKQELLESWSQSARRFSRVDRNKYPEVIPERINGAVIEELRAISQRRETDLIVMGATGENKLLGRFLGGISSEVARKAFCPVLLVPRNSRFESYKKLVYACNYQTKEEDMLGKVVRFAEHFQSELHLVHIDSGKEPCSYKGHRIPVGGFQHGDNLGLFLAHVASSNVLDGLTQYAHDRQAGLVAMSTVHRPFLEDIFRHNLTRDMAIQTQVPLLILHAED